MTTFKHILLATDFEPSSKRALEVAIEMARAFGAELTLLHAWEIPIYPYMDFSVNSDLVSSMEERAKERLEQTLEQVRAQHPKVKAELKTGQPWAAILDAIEEMKPDLVVMGTHGRRGVNHALLGSVAEKVVRQSAVPVLTVHPTVS